MFPHVAFSQGNHLFWWFGPVCPNAPWDLEGSRTNRQSHSLLLTFVTKSNLGCFYSKFKSKQIILTSQN